MNAVSFTRSLHGWEVVATYEDAGVSGAKGRDKRPGFDRLMIAVARREIDMVLRGPLIVLVDP
jgi:DNA invertase Pin-like site-specific DNA recombinase